MYSLFSALIMHVYQMRSSIQTIVEATQERMQVCMNALKEVSKVWLVAKMVHTLFESILGNKVLEERLQKAPGRRHKKQRTDRQPPPQDEQQRRRYDDLELSFANGPPAPQVSYERSRPQTPAITPSADLGQAMLVGSMAAPSTVSPIIRQTTHDAFLGASSSRNNTRPPTPFNPSYSVPATPPDLYLVTRNSPPISQNLWENFQPDHLFPDGTNLGFPQHLPVHHQQNLDPQLQLASMTNPTLQQHSMHGQQHLPQRTMNMQSNPSIQQSNGVPMWNQFSADSPEDNWSNSSRGQTGPSVPATLNVEDW